MWTEILWGFGALILLILCVRWFLQRNDGFWPNQGVYLMDMNDVEGRIKRWTFQINMTDFSLKLYEKFKQAQVKLGGGYMEFTTPVFFPMNLDILRNILVKDFDSFSDRRTIDVKKIEPVLSRVMTNLKGQEWKDLRATMSPTFTTGKIKRMFKHFNACGQHLVSYLKNKENENNSNGVDCVIDFQDAFGRYTMDAVASISFGLETDVFKEDKSIFREMAKRFQSVTLWKILKAVFVVFLPRLAAVFKVKFSDTISMNFFTKIAKQNMEVRRKDGIGKRQDFLDIMLEASNGQLTVDDEDNEVDDYEKDAQLTSTNGTTVSVKKGILDDETILAQCLLFFSAGSDTMETVLTFVSYVMATHPEIQEKLVQEVSVVMEENDGHLTYEAIHKMEYLDMVLSETLRMYPPAAATERTCSRDYIIPDTNILIPKGARIAIPIRGIHHDPEYYPEPHRFNPENFTAEKKASRHPYAYLPFGQGPRNCIAMRFALIEAKSAIAHLMYNFKIEPSEKTQIPVKFNNRSFITKPENGMHLRISSRR